MNNRLALLVIFMILSLYLPHVINATSTTYDEQLGMSLIQNYTALGYNVTAIAQTSGTSGTGPAYLLNGYSNTGYWYQVGLSWNWATTFYGYSPNKFQLVYEVFYPNGTSITNGGGLLTLSGPVNQGDDVLLNLYFKNNTVVFLVKDWNTGATGSTTFPAYGGATTFVGTPYSFSSSEGFFTGLMTEWYGTTSSFPIQQKVTYSPYGYISSPAWLWGDEFYCLQPCYQKSGVTSNISSTYEYPTSSHYLTLTYGSTAEYSSGAIFTTGATPPPPAPPFYVTGSNVKTLEADKGVNLNYFVNISVAGGVAPYNYVLNIDGVPTAINLDNYSTNARINIGNSAMIQVVGNYNYNISVTDSGGSKGTTPSGELIINPDPAITLSSSSITLDVGQKVPVAYVITGGTAPFNVTYIVNGRNVGNNLTGLTSGTYTSYAEVTDADGITAESSPLTLVVNPQPTITISSNSTVSDIGSSISLTLNANGGTLPYSYEWYIDGQPQGTSSSFTFSSASSGQHNVYTSLTDSAGYLVNSLPITLIVNTKPSLSSFRLSPSSGSILYVNNTVNGLLNVLGGTSPYSYKWYVDGILQPNSNASAYLFNLNGVGTHNISVILQDASGQKISDSEMITVGYNLTVLGGGVVIVVIIVAIALYLVLRNKRPNRPNHQNEEKVNKDDDHIKTLKIRYAKGQITKKQYDDMKRDLES